MNPADMAYRMQDIMMGIAGIIPEDYPFACLCNLEGICENDAQSTPCPSRKGMMAGARRGSGAVAVWVIAVLGTVGPAVFRQIF